MRTRRTLSIQGVGLLVFCGAGALATAAAQSPPPAVQQMLQPGVHERALEAQTGSWDVVASLWPTPHSAPMVTKALLAQRTLIGNYLQEIMQPAPGSVAPDFRRIDYLSFDHVEGLWKYVSMDTRFPVSIMPAQSSGLDTEAKLSLLFAPQAFVGFGAAVEGRLMLMAMTITTTDADHFVKEQRVNLADGSGQSWVFARYEYSRHR